ncbi:MAG: tRNA uridine-5-carboxymethylaminomethyl(34) synthesis GTPase MnmE [Burkholderiaceae bacterium]
MLAGLHDAIVAVATASGRGAIGIVRASGPRLEPLIVAICGGPLEARRAHYLPLLGADGVAIDHGVAIYFAAPNSYTGEDVLELQAHGGPVVLQLLLARCLEAGAEVRARIAQPGEFTQRAFLNGKLDLAQAEAVSDLIDASTEAAARAAAQSLSGAFSGSINALAAQLVELRALVEATLDFPDEEIDFLDRADALGRLARIGTALDDVVLRARQGALLRDGIKVVLAGQPNVGKSSLLNALAGAELAIVTPVPGTTRDKVSETIQIEGVPIHVVDTAGLRDSEEPVERIGIERAWGEIARADLVLFLHDTTRAAQADYGAAEVRLAAKLSGAVARGTRVIHVHNKIDVMPPAPGAEGLGVSALRCEGLTALRRVMLDSVGWQLPAEGVFLARARHVHALRRAADHVAQAGQQAAQANPALELYAEELRLAHRALEEITGAFSTEDLLGQIFGRFCIGK